MLNNEKGLKKLMEEIQKKDFKSEDELQEFMSQMIGKSLDDLPESTDDKSRAQDLVYEAYDQSKTQGKKSVKKALELDPNNAEAYNYLGSIETDLEKAIQQYKKAVNAEEESLGKDFFKENKGYFWGLIETRPYMRALAGLAGCYYTKGDLNNVINIFEKMLVLNPNDNQGVRYMFAILLLGQDELKKFELFLKNNEEEDNASWNYNIALYYFKKSGHTLKTEKVLKKAYQSNTHVIDFMLGIKKMPKKLPQYIGMGDENEAVAYINDSYKVWDKTDGALDWLSIFKQKMLKMN